MRIGVRAAKAQLCSLIRKAESGSKIVITRHGKPVIRLHSYAAARQSKDQHSADIVAAVVDNTERMLADLGLVTSSTTRRQHGKRQQ